MAKVKLENISQKFGAVTGIENITFEVPEGAFWVLVGPSGCGKSTILRTIAGLETITEGKLYFNHTLVNQIPGRERDVAMVFQNYALYPHMTVAENLSFGLRMRQVEAQTITQRVETVAKLLNIEHLLNRKPKQLSGGQQQRVALGRAIARQAQVFLLDEPLSNLDAQLREETRTQLKQLHTHYGITTIYVTHDQVEAMTLADQIVILNQGKIQQIGTPQNIYTQPANRMVATFLGSPPMNILPATYLDEVFRIESQSLPLSNQLKKQLNPKPGEAFDLGIRPEDLKIVSQGSGLKVEVRVIEPTGRETIVRGIVTCTDITINWTIPYPWRGNVGDTLLLQPNLAQIFVFDPCSGENLFTPNV